MEEDLIVQERKDKLVSFFKKRFDLWGYFLLAIVIAISTWIRIQPMRINPNTGKPGLWDITTNNWTLGPDLDPFLFLRWAQEIVMRGTLASWDGLRYVPLGFGTKGELSLLAYLIAWFHKIASIFGSTSVEQSAVIYPVVMFALTLIAFFFLVKELFYEEFGVKKSTVVAAVACLLLAVVPSLLPRTIAGIPEKESTAFLFMFLAFYLFIKSWNHKNKTVSFALAVGAGVITAVMALVWGGYIYVFLTLALATLIAFLFGAVSRKNVYVYTLWLIPTIVLMRLFSTRYTIENLLTATTTNLVFLVFGVLILHEIFTRLKVFEKVSSFKKYPPQIVTLVAMIVLGIILASVFFGPGFIIHKADSVLHTLVIPVTDRLGVTVAENRQPYFTEWANSFGPVYSGIPLLFYLFLIGSVYFVFNTFKQFKESWILTGAYAVLLVGLIFSRYSQNGALNGDNFLSLLLYFGSAALFGITLFLLLTRHHRSENRQFAHVSFNRLLLFALFVFSIVSARGAVRLVLVLVPAAAIFAAYLLVALYEEYRKKEKSNMKTFVLLMFIVVLLVSIVTVYQLYKISDATAQQYVPSSYTQQWQMSMAWVRDNVPANAVFGHWWDYGYWVQSIGKRATVLDGGNYIPYWNHLMGRYALTGSNEQEALDFLYTHNTTHFLIDSSDIGKYAAFSSIGSDINYDRRSWISTFLRDDSQSREGKNTTTYVYTGGFPLDGDILYTINNTLIVLPGAGASNVNSKAPIASLAAILITIDSSGRVSQPLGIFVYRGSQYSIPLRYAFSSKGITDFKNGIDAGVFLMQEISQNNLGQGVLVENGAALFLSERTVHSQLAKLYLYNQKVSGFTLVHNQPDPVVSSLRAQNLAIDDFVYYQGVRGPIKIWEINYPAGTKVVPQYLETTYPERGLLYDN